MKKMIGNKCYLSPVDLKDSKLYTSWLADMEITIYLRRSSQVITVHEEEEMLKSLSKNDNTFVMGIHDQITDKLIGICGLQNTNLIDRNSEFGIFIGDKNYQGKGYGKEAVMLMLDYGFNVINLNSIYLYVFEYNQLAYQLYKKCGFKEVGCLRQAKIIAGKKYNIMIMDILSEEFQSIYVETVVKGITG